MALECPRVNRWLLDIKRISVPGDWLEACIEWILSENEGSCPSTTELCNLVYDQWLVADLHEIGSSCLPAEIATDAKHVLSGIYSLQVDSITEVSHSFYSQLQKVTGTENNNVLVSAAEFTQQPTNNSSSSSGRMLMLKLTDGSVEVKGMEYRPIPALNISMSPGLKIQVRGTVLCRCGVMMLKGDNVSVLGGEVETMADAGRPENIISSNLSQNVQLCENRPNLPRTVFDVDKKRPSDRSIDTHIPPPTSLSSRSIKNSISSAVADDDFPDDDDLLISSELNTDNFNLQQGVGHLNSSTTIRPPSITDTGPRPCNKRLLDKQSRPNTNASSDARSPSGAYELMAKKIKAEAMDFEDELGDDELDDILLAETTLRLHRDSPGGLNYPDVTCRGNIGQLRETTINERTITSNDVKENHNSSVSRTRDKCIKSVAGLGALKVETSFVRPAHAFGLDSEQVAKLTKHRNSITDAATSSRSRAIDLPVSGYRVQDYSEPLVCVEPMDDSAASSTGTLFADSSFFRNESSLIGDSRSERGILKGIDHTAAVTRTTCPNDPFTYISLILSDPSKCSGHHFNVKAYIVTLVSRLEHNNGQYWSLTVKINDGSATLDAVVSDEMLVSLIGFTAQQSLNIKEGKSDKQSRIRLTEGVRRCQDTLTGLSAILEISLSDVSVMWRIGRYRPVTWHEVNMLKERSRHYSHVI